MAFKYPVVYKIENNIIKKEKVVANPWYCLTTVDAGGQYYSYPIGEIDKGGNIFTHIILAYNRLKNGADINEN